MFYLLKTKRIIKSRSRQQRFYYRIIGDHIIILNNQFGQFMLSYFYFYFFKILSSEINFGFIDRRGFIAGAERIDFI